MKVLIVDDERRARERLIHMLADEPEMEIAGEAEDGLGALTAMAGLRPDAVFLDVQMPGLTGLEVAAALPEASRPWIVFVTAYDQYALQAFEVNAVDYLMKPVEADRLAAAVRKLRDRAKGDGIAQLVSALRQQTGRSLERVVGKRLNQYHVLPVESIEAFLSDDELVFAITPAGRFLVERTLRELEATLPGGRFLRVHKQTIVNLEKLAVLEPVVRGGVTARLRSGETVEVSRRYTQQLRERLGW
jgi:two-component system, LytTR family, response regulator